MWPLFGHELAANSIGPAEVVCAVGGTRFGTGVCRQQGGRYVLGQIYKNSKCEAPAAFVTLAQNFLANEVKNFGNSVMPQGDSGFKAATPAAA